MTWGSWGSLAGELPQIALIALAGALIAIGLTELSRAHVHARRLINRIASRRSKRNLRKPRPATLSRGVRLRRSLPLLVPLVIALTLAGSANGLLPRFSGADLSRCDPTDVRCLAEQVDRLTTDLGPEGALRELRELSDRDREVDYRCHSLAHRVGLTALGREGGAAGAIIAARGEVRSCADGYIHGVMLGALGSLESEAVAAGAEEICTDPRLSEPLRSAGNGALSNCLHGAGHGIYSASGGSIERALELCYEAFDRAPFNEDFGVTRCANGAFMEALIPTVSDEAVTDPIERCEALTFDSPADELLDLCYVNAADAASRSSERRPDPLMLDRCLAVREAYVDACIVGLLSHPSNESDAGSLLDFCGRIGDPTVDGSEAEHCIETIISDISIHRPDDPRATELCSLLAARRADGPARDARIIECLHRYLAEVVDYWGDPGLVDRVCALLPTESLVRSCRERPLAPIE
jgi:hypothetical protein